MCHSVFKSTIIISDSKFQRKKQIPMTEEKENTEPNLPLGILGCIGGLLLQLIAGSLYQWGIISIYITSYFKTNDSSLTLEQTSISVPLMMIAVGFTMSLGLHLAQLTHPLIILVLSQVLLAATIFVSSFMDKFWPFVIFYGVIFGLVAGIGFMIPLAECNKYLVGKKMYVNGFILVGAGLGSVIFGQFSYNFINPEDISPLNGYYLGSPQREQIALQVPTLMRWLSLWYLGIGLLGSAFVAPIIIKNRRAQNQHEQKRREKQLAHEAKKHHVDNKIQNCQKIQNHENHQNNQHHQKKNKEKKHLTRHQRKHLHEAHSMTEAVKSRVFWISNLIFLFSSVGVFLVTSNYKTFVKTMIKDDEFLTLIGVIGGIGNGCSRFFWNLFFSKTGFKTVLLTILGLSTIVLVTIRFTVQIKEAYLIQIFILNCCVGGFLVATPTGLQSIYGHTTGSKIYGLYWATFSISNMIAWVYVSQLTNVIGFNNVIYICLFMLGISYPIVIFIKFQGPWKNDTTQLEFLVSKQIIKRDQQRQQQLKKAQLQHKVTDQVNVKADAIHTNDQKAEKGTESTASHIPSFVELKFSKKVLIDKKVKLQDPNMDLTSLKILDENNFNIQGQKEEGVQDAEVPNIESTNALKEGENEGQQKIQTN